MTDRADRLRQARIAAGFHDATEAAQRFGWRPPTYLGHENGSRGIKYDKAVAYAKAFKVSANWILDGGADSVVGADDGGSAELDALVPVYDVAASAGHGSSVDGEIIEAHIALSRDYLRDVIGASERNLKVIKVQGHSMEPTLNDGDLVMLDATKRDLSYDGLFVIRFDNALHVKRVGRAPKRGHVEIISDHPSYGRQVWSIEELEPVGRVLWVGRKV